MSPRSRKSQLWLGFGGLLVALLLAAVVTLGSLRLPFEPRQWREVVILFALSAFIVAALMVFGLILLRTLLRLWAERRAHQLGARFKTKMVLGAMAISLLPVVFLFYVSYSLLNRTLARWFPRPLEIATEESRKLLDEFCRAEDGRLRRIANLVISNDQQGFALKMAPRFLTRSIEQGADAAWVLGPREEYVRGVRAGAGEAESRPGRRVNPLPPPRHVQNLPIGAEVWETTGEYYLAFRVVDIDFGAPVETHHAEQGLFDARPLLGSFLIARVLPKGFLNRYVQIQAQVAAYDQQKQLDRAFKSQMLLILVLFTVLVLFSATWFAVFLSKQVTVPIQALAEATREVTAGNFDYRVETEAQEELGVLVRSFNQMTAQLSDSRRQIDEFTRSLQQAVQELDRRRKLMEAILENIPTGVLSLNGGGTITRINPAIEKIFGEMVRSARTLDELAGEEAARGVQQLMRRSLRMGAASRELEIALPGRVLHAAVTVSALGPRRSNPGFVVVVDDLTELLRAQKAAAWQEVAQRIAHEIKNPLTPIQLSAQRLNRHLERQREAAVSGGASDANQDSELPRMVGECAGLIEREVAALKSLVDEFSQFARFPAARLTSADINAIAVGALDIFRGRLDGITVRTRFASGLPAVRADAELLRRVLVNLIDNAAEALEGAAAQELSIETRSGADGDTVEITVADSGTGISPEDKDKLFLPHFSTKERGTGLGLAIAGRIITEHHGTIRIEDNSPVGARFVIQLPVAEVPAAPLSSET